jgi:uncharacterized protein YdhG (YjbR/CyaY superfamily)
MTSDASTAEEYIEQLPEDRKPVIQKLRKIVSENLPDGFEETMQYGMIGYVVPHSKYPDGYHVNPEIPLPFMNLASQKNHIAVYHSGIYTDEELMNWFTKEYKDQVATKLDMGKSCIRFKNPKHIPFDLIGELSTKMTPDEWVKKYEEVIKR